VRYLLTSNYLLSKEDVEIYYDERVLGGRTGITRNYDRSLAVSAEAGNMRLLCVLTGAASKISSNGYSVSVFGGYQEVSKILDACFDGYYVAQVVYEGQSVTQQPVTNGDCDVVLGSKNTAYAVVPVNTKLSDLTYSLVSRDSLVAPIEAGQKMTEVDIWLNDDCVAEAELYAMNDVRVQGNAVSGDRNPAAAAPAQPVKKSGMSWGWIILIVFLIAAIIVLLPRFAAAYRYNQKRARIRRRRKSRS
jgi:D-alanyl-D-alanine carboxypeptidase